MNTKRELEKFILRKEVAANYFFDMSKLVFATCVLGVVTLFITTETMSGLYYTFFVGCLGTWIFAMCGYKTLK